MSRGRIALLAAGLVCLAAAVILALLARDVGARQAAFRAGDLASADTDPVSRPSWSAQELVPFGLARRLLGVDDDLAFRQAVAHFRRAHTGISSFELSPAGTALRVKAETALARELRVDHDRRRASVAANLLGVLAFVDSTSTGNNAAPVDRSIFAFQDAIHLDSADDQAKTNLELVYQTPEAANTLRGHTRQAKSTQSGASTAAQGHGY